MIDRLRRPGSINCESECIAIRAAGTGHDIVDDIPANLKVVSCALDVDAGRNICGGGLEVADLKSDNSDVAPVLQIEQAGLAARSQARAIHDCRLTWKALE